MSRAIIVGSSGQDGTILTQKLTLLGYDILGIGKDRTYSSIQQFDQLNLSISSKNDVFNIVKEFQANQIFYLAAFQNSSVQIIDDEDSIILKNSLEINLISLQYFLEAIFLYSKKTVVFYASSSHIFGDTLLKKQNEETSFSPIDYYGITKVAGIQLCKYYRNNKSLSVAVGIMYNHESIYRKETFVSIHIIRGALDIYYGKKNELVLGDLDAMVDWGSAFDYVDAMISLLDKRISGDFIISTGKQHSVKEFVQVVFNYLNLDSSKYLSESKNFVKKGRNNLCGDYSKIQKMVGWEPKIPFQKMITDMVDYFKENFYEK